MLTLMRGNSPLQLFLVGGLVTDVKESKFWTRRKNIASDEPHTVMWRKTKWRNSQADKNPNPKMRFRFCTCKEKIQYYNRLVSKQSTCRRECCFGQPLIVTFMQKRRFLTLRPTLLISTRAMNEYRNCFMQWMKKYRIFQHVQWFRFCGDIFEIMAMTFAHLKYADLSSIFVA